MTLPDYSGGGFYDPQKSYTGYLQPQYPAHNISSGSGPMDDALFRSHTTDIDPRSEYLRRLSKMGLGGQGSRAKSFQGMYNDVASGYGQAKIGSNINLYFPEFLDQTDLQTQFDNMSYEQQGLDPGRFGQGKYRWGQRSG